MNDYEYEGAAEFEPPSEKLTADEVLRLRPRAHRLARLHYGRVFALVVVVAIAAACVVWIGVALSSSDSSASKQDSVLAIRPNDAELLKNLPVGPWGRDYSFLQQRVEDDATETDSGDTEQIQPLLGDSSGLPDALDQKLLEERLKRLQDGFDSPIVLIRRPFPEDASKVSAFGERPSLDALNATNLTTGVSEASPDRLFLRGATQPSFTTTGRLVTPESQYEVRAGSVLPAALLTEIHSDTYR